MRRNHEGVVKRGKNGTHAYSDELVGFDLDVSFEGLNEGKAFKRPLYKAVLFVVAYLFVLIAFVPVHEYGHALYSWLFGNGEAVISAEKFFMGSYTRLELEHSEDYWRAGLYGGLFSYAVWMSAYVIVVYLPTDNTVPLETAFMGSALANLLYSFQDAFANQWLDEELFGVNKYFLVARALEVTGFLIPLVIYALPLRTRYWGVTFKLVLWDSKDECSSIIDGETVGDNSKKKFVKCVLETKLGNSLPLAGIVSDALLIPSLADKEIVLDGENTGIVVVKINVFRAIGSLLVVFLLVFLWLFLAGWFPEEPFFWIFTGYMYVLPLLLVFMLSGGFPVPTTSNKSRMSKFLRK